MRLDHWNANTGYYRQSDGSGYADHMTRAYGRLIAAAGAFATPAPLRGPDDPWRLHVLAHPHGPRVLQARIVAPDELPIAVLAVAEGGGAGQRRAWRDTVAEAPWLIDGRDPGDFRDPPDGPWVIMALLPALAVHPEAVEWLGDVEQCIAWAFLESLQPMTERMKQSSGAGVSIRESRGTTCRNVWSCPALTDTFPFGPTMEVCHGGKSGAVSARVPGATGRAGACGP